MASRPSLDSLIKDISQDKLDSRCIEEDLKLLALSTTKWRLLAPFMGLNELEEREIMREYPDNIRRQTIALYIRWRAKALTNATYRRLIEKLYTIGRIDLVEKVVKLLTQSKSHYMREDDDPYTIYLRRLYRTQVPRHVLYWPPLPHCKYVNLSMIQEEEEHQRNIEDEGLQKADIQHVLEKKKHLQVTLDNILTIDESERKCIVIEGAPGVGKSTLTLHACQEWATGTLFESYTFVILIQLHHPTVHEAKCLADVLPHRPNEAKYAKILADKIVSEDGENTLFIIDGWDEFPSQHRKESFIHEFLFKPQNLGVNMSTVLITSRRNASTDLQQIATSRVKILGFAPVGIKDYFMEVLKKRYKVERLFAYLQQYPSLHSNCHIPLNAAIIAYVYICSHGELPSTLHGVFCRLMLICILHDISRKTPERELKVSSLSDLPPDLYHKLNQIAFLAHKGSLQVKGTFSEDELKQLHLPSAFPTLGLLQEVEYFAHFHKAKQYSFVHTSVQSFLTAFYISQWEPALQAEVFSQSFAAPPLLVVIFAFLSPVLSRYNLQPYIHSVFKHLAGFTRLEGSEMQKSVLEVIDKYKAEYNVPLVILKHTISYMRSQPFLSLVECLYDANNRTLYELVASHLEGKITLAYVTLTLHQFLSLGRLLCFFRPEETIVLYLSRVYIYDEGLDYLFREFKGQTCTLKLYLDSNELCFICAEFSIAPLLRTNKLVHLDLSYNSISNEGAKHIASALVSNISLLVLVLNYCVISDEGIQKISHAISENHTLQELCLSGNLFTDDGLMLLSIALEQNKGLRKLRINPRIDRRMKDVLKYNCTLSRVTGRGLQLFVSGMADNAHITELDIGEFGAEDEGVIEALKLINEDRKKRDIQVLILFCSEYTLYGSDVLDLKF